MYSYSFFFLVENLPLCVQFLFFGRHLQTFNRPVTLWPPPHYMHPSFASEALGPPFILCRLTIGCTWLPWRAPSYSNLHQLNLAPTYHEQPNFNHNPSFQRNIPYPTHYLHPDQDNLLFFFSLGTTLAPTCILEFVF